MADKITRKNSNGYSQEQVKRFVTSIENCQDEVDKIMDAAKEDAKEHRDDIKQLYKDAKEEGIDPKALRMRVKHRRQEKKAKEDRAKLDAEQKDAYDAIRHQLGELKDTPLGAAALDAVRKRGAEILDGARAN